MIRALTAAVVLSLALGLGGASAQSPAPSEPKMTAAQKQAISKECSAQADAKGLHGKARKKFRSACRKKGGK
jgi:hypothetical protein